MAYAMYMKVEGVDGDSTDAAHDKWIEVVSYSHGLSQAFYGSGSREAEQG